MTSTFEQSFNSLMQLETFSLSKQQKSDALLPVFCALHQHHLRHCDRYKKLADGFDSKVQTVDDFPFLAVRLFKQFALKSIPDEDVFRVLQSSGTTGQVPSSVYLDKQTSARQSKVLVKIMQSFIGKHRLPMLVIDCPSVLKSKAMSARAAGIQGLSFFGREMTFALNDDMTLNLPEIHRFCDKHGAGKVLIFGFTFMIWQYFIERLQALKTPLSLPDGIMIHSGGWKKLKDKAVDNAAFKRAVSKLTGINHIHNFYGMAEQVGSVFVECEDGHLHVPSMADVLIRDPYSLAVLPQNEAGIIQVLSSVPTSYPGWSILTEDLGRVLGEDDCSCGRKGKVFEVIGRLPRAEIRGCSDTHGVSV